MPSIANDPNSIAGFVDIDTDQDPGTGVTSLIEWAGGSTGLGVDHFVSLFADDAGRFTIADVANDTLGVITGLTTPVFSANSVTIEVFLSSLGGDDGNVNVSAILGTPIEATDFVPNQGHIVLVPVGAAPGAGTSKDAGPTPVRGRVGPWGRALSSYELSAFAVRPSM